jgi:hypothetical protein
MKRSHLITIAITLVVATFWLAHEVKKESTLPEQTRGHQDGSQSVERATLTRTSHRSSSSEKLTESDWAEVASDLKYLSKQVDKFKPSPALGKRLKYYTKSELISAMHSTRHLDLDNQAKVNLSRYLLTLIVQLDPAGFCLDPYAASLSPYSRPYWERFAIAEWVRLSPAEAAEWLDSTAKKSHEPKQVTALEHNLFSALVVVDFEQAKARFLATPKDQRHRMMQNFDGFGSYWAGDDFENHNIAGRFADLARLHAPGSSESFITSVISGRGEQDRPAGISRIQDSLKGWKESRGTWLPATTVADYLDKIDATPREQERCLEAVVHQFKYHQKDGDLAAFRERFAAEVHEIRSQN